MSDDLPVTRTTILREGFVACYDHKQWGTGYLTSDECANAFSQTLDNNHIHDDIEKAHRDRKNIEKMKTYHGHGNVLFGTVKVVYYTERATHTDCTDETVVRNFIAERALSRLSDVERAAIETYYDMSE